jgi:restriction system protein
VQLGANVAGQLGKILAMFGQYIVPLAFIIGAGISAYGRHKRSALLADVQNEPSASALNGMTWQEFEMLVGEAFRRGGYAVTETGGVGADGGVDLVLRKDGEKFLVQCKQWKAFSVGVTIIRELYGVMAATGAAGGFVVTSGKFTQEARSFAEGRNIDLIDGAELTAIIKEIRPPASQQPRAIAPATTSSPNCPTCGGAMIKRTAKQGANAGNQFWGCSNYPQCRGIVSI